MLANGGSGSPTYPHPASTTARPEAAPTLPIRIRCALQTYLIGCTLHVEDAGLGLTHALGGVFHDRAPRLVATGHRVHRDFQEVTLAHQVLQALWRLLLVVGV